MSNYSAANSAYTNASVTTAPKERLVVMLYDGAIRFLRQGEAAYQNGRLDHAHDRIRKADAIINELNLSLDMSYGEVPQRLRSIYLFCKRQFNEAIVNRDAAPLVAVQALLLELREAWDEIAATPAARDALAAAAVA